MTELTKQILYFADPRFTGGTSTAFAAEIAAHAQAGEAAQFVPVFSHLVRRSRGFHPALAAAMQAGQLVAVSPDLRQRVPLAIVHHPALFGTLPTRPFGVSAERALLVLHHPPFDALGTENYPLDVAVTNLRECLSAEVILAPVGPLVREQLGRLNLAGASVLDVDWHNLIDADTIPTTRAPRHPNGPLIIGRHSRPDMLKFPDTRQEALLAYPDWPDLRVRMLGVPGGDGTGRWETLEQRYGPLPLNWELLPFGAQNVGHFLSTLDLWVYAHGSAWAEAFGYAALEAMAAGLPVLLPHAFEPLFGEAAVYCAPEDYPAQIDRFRDPRLRDSQGTTAARLAREHFGIARHRERLKAVLGNASSPAVAAAPEPRRSRVLLATSNGVGLGHVSRMLGLSRRLPSAEIEFFTMSQAYGLAIEAGHPTRFFPHFGITGADPARWELALETEFGDHLDFFDPDVVVFDGNVPYDGFIAALRLRPGIRKIWMRRAMWSQTASDLMSRSADFDLVLTPEEFSARFDDGATTHGDDAVLVGPIVNVTPNHWLSREDARARIGVAADKTLVGVMLGSGSSFDIRTIRSTILGYLARQPSVEVVEFLQPLREADPGEGHRTLEEYPASRLFNGLDLLIGGAGYNTFHEAIAGGVPAVFVPNEAEDMDLQIVRARHAEAIGVACCLRADDRLAAPRVLASALSPDWREAARQRLARIRLQDGAADAAHHVAALAAARRMRATPTLG